MENKPGRRSPALKRSFSNQVFSTPRAGNDKYILPSAEVNKLI